MVEHYKPLTEILPYIKGEYQILGDVESLIIKNIKPIGEANEYSLVWVDPKRKDKFNLVNETKSRAIICDPFILETINSFPDKCFIVVDNPKYTINQLLNEVFDPRSPVFGVHPTAFVENSAKVHEKSYIGPFSYIGESEIGEGVIIDGHVHIYNNVIIGRNVKIQAGCVIGADAINQVYDNQGGISHFHHIGGVRIGDNCRIDAMTHIGRGALGDTIIESNVAIDNNVYIAHNSRIGSNTTIIGHSMICGSVSIGQNCWIGPGTIIRDQIKIGNNCFVGSGSLVVKNIADDVKVMGSPAIPMDEYLKIREKIKGLK